MQISGSGNPLSSGLAGIQKGQDKVTQAAQEVASATTQRPVQAGQEVESRRGVKAAELEKALIDQRQGQRQGEVSAKVVEAGSQMIGSLVDISV
jgi:hypothetical protein